MKAKTPKFSNPLTEKLSQQRFYFRKKHKPRSITIASTVDHALDKHTDIEDLQLPIKTDTPIPPRLQIDWKTHELVINYKDRHPLTEIRPLKEYEKWAFSVWKQDGVYERNYEIWRSLFLACEMSDAIVHVCDCRSMLLEPQLFELYKRPHIVVLNKIDLVDKDVVGEFKRVYPNTMVTTFTCKDPGYAKRLLELLSPYRRVAIVGYPNVGKSSLINSLVGRKRTAVSKTPGKTKYLQTLQIGKMVIVDTPGLVFRRYSKEVLVVNGVLNVDQMSVPPGVDAVKYKKEIKRRFLGE